MKGICCGADQTQLPVECGLEILLLFSSTVALLRFALYNVRPLAHGGRDHRGQSLHPRVQI